MRLLVPLFFLTALVLLGVLSTHQIIEFDQDLGRHLLVGKIISETGSVPKTNLLSYTASNFPFVNSHWLAEVFFYQTNRLFGGAQSLLYLKVILFVSAFGLTLWTTFKYSKNNLATAVAFLVFVPVLLERTEIRPEIFSYLFAAIFLYVLLFDLKKWFWVLPLLELLWVNLHIYFILGPMLVGIFWICRRKRTYLLYGLLTFIAALFNPNGFGGAAYPLKVFDNYGYSIQENQNIFFLEQVTSNPNIIYFKVAITLLGLSFLVVSFREISLLNLLLGSLAVLPLLHIRSFPLLFLFCLPVAAFNLAEIRKWQVWAKFKQFKSLLLIFVVGVTLVRILRLGTNEYYFSIDSPKRFGNEIAESGKGVVDFVLKNNLRGPIFNNFDIGSYLDYRLYPGEKVFIDGRPEAYPKDFIQSVYIPMQLSWENFDKIDKTLNFKLIIFSHTDQTPWARNFLGELIKNPGYQLVYLDSYGIVFVKKEAYPEIANRYALGKQEVKNRYFNGLTSVSYLEDLYLASVSGLFGWDDLSVLFLERAVSKNPQSKFALLLLAKVYQSSPEKISLGKLYEEKFRQRSFLPIF